MKSIRRILRSAVADLPKYSPDQDRDDHGRWSAGGGGSDPRSASTTPADRGETAAKHEYHFGGRDDNAARLPGPVSEAGAKHDAQIAMSGAELDQLPTGKSASDKEDESMAASFARMAKDEQRVEDARIVARNRRIDRDVASQPPFRVPHQPR